MEMEMEHVTKLEIVVCNYCWPILNYVCTLYSVNFNFSAQEETAGNVHHVETVDNPLQSNGLYKAPIGPRGVYK